jgi:hypothetical protein
MSSLSHLRMLQSHFLPPHPSLNRHRTLRTKLFPTTARVISLRYLLRYFPPRPEGVSVRYLLSNFAPWPESSRTLITNSFPTTALVIYASYFQPQPNHSHLRKLLTKSLPTTS